MVLIQGTMHHLVNTAPLVGLANSMHQCRIFGALLTRGGEAGEVVHVDG